MPISPEEIRKQQTALKDALLPPTIAVSRQRLIAALKQAAIAYHTIKMQPATTDNRNEVNTKFAGIIRFTPSTTGGSDTQVVNPLLEDMPLADLQSLVNRTIISCRSTRNARSIVTLREHLNAIASTTNFTFNEGNDPAFSWSSELYAMESGLSNLDTRLAAIVSCVQYFETNHTQFSSIDAFTAAAEFLETQCKDFYATALQTLRTQLTANLPSSGETPDATTTIRRIQNLNSILVNLTKISANINATGLNHLRTELRIDELIASAQTAMTSQATTVATLIRQELASDLNTVRVSGLTGSMAMGGRIGVQSRVGELRAAGMMVLRNAAATIASNPDAINQLIGNDVNQAFEIFQFHQDPATRKAFALVLLSRHFNELRGQLSEAEADNRRLELVTALDLTAAYELFSAYTPKPNDTTEIAATKKAIQAKIGKYILSTPKLLKTLLAEEGIEKLQAIIESVGIAGVIQLCQGLLREEPQLALYLLKNPHLRSTLEASDLLELMSIPAVIQALLAEENRTTLRALIERIDDDEQIIAFCKTTLANQPEQQLALAEFLISDPEYADRMNTTELMKIIGAQKAFQVVLANPGLISELLEIKEFINNYSDQELIQLIDIFISRRGGAVFNQLDQIFRYNGYSTELIARVEQIACDRTFIKFGEEQNPEIKTHLAQALLNRERFAARATETQITALVAVVPTETLMEIANSQIYTKNPQAKKFIFKALLSRLRIHEMSETQCATFLRSFNGRDWVNFLNAASGESLVLLQKVLAQDEFRYQLVGPVASGTPAHTIILAAAQDIDGLIRNNVSEARVRTLIASLPESDRVDLFIQYQNQVREYRRNSGSEFASRFSGAKANSNEAQTYARERNALAKKYQALANLALNVVFTGVENVAGPVAGGEQLSRMQPYCQQLSDAQILRVLPHLTEDQRMAMFFNSDFSNVRNVMSANWQLYFPRNVDHITRLFEVLPPEQVLNLVYEHLIAHQDQQNARDAGIATLVTLYNNRIANDEMRVLERVNKECRELLLSKFMIVRVAENVTPSTDNTQQPRQARRFEEGTVGRGASDEAKEYLNRQLAYATLEAITTIDTFDALADHPLVGGMGIDERVIHLSGMSNPDFQAFVVRFLQTDITQLNEHQAAFYGMMLLTLSTKPALFIKLGVTQLNDLNGRIKALSESRKWIDPRNFLERGWDNLKKFVRELFDWPDDKNLGNLSPRSMAMLNLFHEIQTIEDPQLKSRYEQILVNELFSDFRASTSNREVTEKLAAHHKYGAAFAIMLLKHVPDHEEKAAFIAFVTEKLTNACKRAIAENNFAEAQKILVILLNDDNSRPVLLNNNFALLHAIGFTFAQISTVLTSDQLNQNAKQALILYALSTTAGFAADASNSVQVNQLVRQLDMAKIAALPAEQIQSLHKNVRMQILEDNTLRTALLQVNGFAANFDKVNALGHGFSADDIKKLCAIAINANNHTQPNRQLLTALFMMNPAAVTEYLVRPNDPVTDGNGITTDTNRSPQFVSACQTQACHLLNALNQGVIPTGNSRRTDFITPSLGSDTNCGLHTLVKFTTRRPNADVSLLVGNALVVTDVVRGWDGMCQEKIRLQENKGRANADGLLFVFKNPGIMAAASNDQVRLAVVAAARENMSPQKFLAAVENDASNKLQTNIKSFLIEKFKTFSTLDTDNQNAMWQLVGRLNENDLKATITAATVKDVQPSALQAGFTMVMSEPEPPSREIRTQALYAITPEYLAQVQVTIPPPEANQRNAVAHLTTQYCTKPPQGTSQDDALDKIEAQANRLFKVENRSPGQNVLLSGMSNGILLNDALLEKLCERAKTQVRNMEKYEGSDVITRFFSTEPSSSAVRLLAHTVNYSSDRDLLKLFYSKQTTGNGQQLHSKRDSLLDTLDLIDEKDSRILALHRPAQRERIIQPIRDKRSWDKYDEDNKKSGWLARAWGAVVYGAYRAANVFVANSSGYAERIEENERQVREIEMATVKPRDQRTPETPSVDAVNGGSTARLTTSAHMNPNSLRNPVVSAPSASASSTPTPSSASSSPPRPIPQTPMQPPPDDSQRPRGRSLHN